MQYEELINYCRFLTNFIRVKDKNEYSVKNIKNLINNSLK